MKRKFVSALISLSRIYFPFLVQVPPVGTKGGLVVVASKLGFEIERILLNRSQISFLVYSDPPSFPWLSDLLMFMLLLLGIFVRFFNRI
jgi:hypothetical protein